MIMENLCALVVLNNVILVKILIRALYVNLDQIDYRHLNAIVRMAPMMIILPEIALYVTHPV